MSERLAIVLYIEGYENSIPGSIIFEGFDEPALGYEQLVSIGDIKGESMDFERDRFAIRMDESSLRDTILVSMAEGHDAIDLLRRQPRVAVAAREGRNGRELHLSPLR